MWFADIFCDIGWVAKRGGVLSNHRMRLSGAHSQSLDLAIEFHFYGDDEIVRHVRVLMHTDDRETAETCVNLNVQSWVAALEATVMMETGKPFHVARIGGSQTFAIGLGQGTADEPALVITPTDVSPRPIDYTRVAQGFSAWDQGVEQHLFYFRRLVDDSLPLDVRWLNGYRLLEWHFVRGRASLPRVAEWRTFVTRFQAHLMPLARPAQTAVGLLEEARALAAHAGLDDRPESERRRDPRNAMERTFRVLETMVITVLNDRAASSGHPVRFVTQVP